jgi:hypothetical protein
MKATASSSKSKSNKKHTFKAQAFLDSAGVAREHVEFRGSEKVYSQGDPATKVMYIQEGGVAHLCESGTGSNMNLQLSFTAWAFHPHHDIWLAGHRWVSVRILPCAVPLGLIQATVLCSKTLQQSRRRCWSLLGKPGQARF